MAQREIGVRLVEEAEVDIACGHSHCVAIDTPGLMYSWSDGGSGRLGYKDMDYMILCQRQLGASSRCWLAGRHPEISPSLSSFFLVSQRPSIHLEALSRIHIGVLPCIQIFECISCTIHLQDSRI